MATEGLESSVAFCIPKMIYWSEAVMSLIVKKFGGTSVGTVDRIRHVADRIIRTKNEGHQCVVVVSAMGDATDELVDLAKQLTSNPNPREMDMLLTTGEQVSVALLTMALQAKGCGAVSMTGWQAGIQTESMHGRARITDIRPIRVQNALAQGQVVVVAGFQGITEEGEIVTLGRGGSDTSAVSLAAALDADLCEIYTDVTGVYTADPRIVKSASKLNGISYDEMLELATLGAVVLHPRAVECAKQHQVPLTVRSTFADEEGTLVEEVSQMEKGLVVRGVAHDMNVAKVKVLKLPNRIGMMSKLFTILASAHINVDIIVQSEHGEENVDVSFSIGSDDATKTCDLLEGTRKELGFEEIVCESNLAKVSIVGAGMITNPGVAAQMFEELAKAKIPIKMVSTSEIKVSCVVPRDYAVAGVKALHSVFGLDALQTVGLPR
jgi:aspartate kinase